MPRISQTVTEEVERYRRVAAALRNLSLTELDAMVWAEYMERHPIDLDDLEPPTERKEDR